MKPSNWIEGMSMELKQKRRDLWLRLFVYLRNFHEVDSSSWR